MADGKFVRHLATDPLNLTKNINFVGLKTIGIFIDK